METAEQELRQILEGNYEAALREGEPPERSFILALEATLAVYSESHRDFSDPFVQVVSEIIESRLN